MSKFKKIDKIFTLGDSSLNSYSYRLLTSGFALDDFKRNPIGYYMHGGTKDAPRDLGVLVRWEDIAIKDDAITAKPCINLTHPRGQRTVDEIEAGFLNAASFGSNKVLEISTDPADYVPGQTGITAKKWLSGECSLVDRGGNYNATASDLIDENDHPIDLATFAPPKNITMKKIELSPAQLAAIPNLSAEPTQGEIDTALADLVAKAGRVDSLVTSLATETTAKEKALQDLADLKAETVKVEVADLIAAGNTAGKFSVEAGKLLAKNYATNPTGLKDLIATMQPAMQVTKQLDPSKQKLADLIDKSYEELDKANKLEDLKAIDPDSYYEKFEAKYGKRHINDTRK